MVPVVTNGLMLVRLFDPYSAGIQSLEEESYITGQVYLDASFFNAVQVDRLTSSAQVRGFII
jgi:hypothetical protein